MQPFLVIGVFQKVTDLYFGIGEILFYLLKLLLCIAARKLFFHFGERTSLNSHQQLAQHEKREQEKLIPKPNSCPIPL